MGRRSRRETHTMLVNCQDAMLDFEHWAGSLPEWPSRRGSEVDHHSFLRTALSTPGFWKKVLF
jgi:hypothetical protein